MYLVQKLDRLVSGYWDGGQKSEFHWFIDHTKQTQPNFAFVGSWDANRWFRVSRGKTEKATLGNARRALAAHAKKFGVGCTFEYKES